MRLYHTLPALSCFPPPLLISERFRFRPSHTNKSHSTFARLPYKFPSPRSQRAAETTKTRSQRWRWRHSYLGLLRMVSSLCHLTFHVQAWNADVLLLENVSSGPVCPSRIVRLVCIVHRPWSIVLCLYSGVEDGRTQTQRHTTPRRKVSVHKNEYSFDDIKPGTPRAWCLVFVFCAACSDGALCHTSTLYFGCCMTHVGFKV